MAASCGVVVENEDLERGMKAMKTSLREKGCLPSSPSTNIVGKATKGAD
jgi:hypothetical protein